MEGYANLEHWVAELDKKIELVLLKRLTHIIQVWCTEFDRTDDADTRRDHTREASSKRRLDKRAKDEKVRGSCSPPGLPSTHRWWSSSLRDI